MKRSQIVQIVKEVLQEESKGLWANIRAKQARGEKPARKGSEAHKAAVKAGNDLKELDASTSASNKLPGGLAQYATIGDLAQMHKLPVVDIIKQLMKGVEVESEHTTDLDIAMEIAFDHVYEDPKYYDKIS